MLEDGERKGEGQTGRGIGRKIEIYIVIERYRFFIFTLWLLAFHLDRYLSHFCPSRSVSRWINRAGSMTRHPWTLGLSLMLMTLMLPCGPLTASAFTRFPVWTAAQWPVPAGARDNPEGPIQINTLLLTSSQTSSLHYHSIKTAYMSRPGLQRAHTV